MAQLSLVKSLSRLRDEQRHQEEVTLDAYGLTLGRGDVIEVAGGPSTGKTSIAMSLLARLTGDGEVCAVVDACGGFDPAFAVKAGVRLDGLLWVRCGGELEKAFMAADMLVQAKGFGGVWLDLGGLPERQLRLVPRSYWYRYRSRIRETPTILLVTAEQPVTGSASQSAYTAERERIVWSGQGRYKLLREMHLKTHSRKGHYGDAIRSRIAMDHTEA
jgi:hypothetical protein